MMSVSEQKKTHTALFIISFYFIPFIWNVKLNIAHIPFDLEKMRAIQRKMKSPNCERIEILCI